MRIRKKELIITFDTTAEAMKMEALASEHDKRGRLIPLPSQVSAGCGLAFMTRELTADDWHSFCKAQDIAYKDICEVLL